MLRARGGGDDVDLFAPNLTIGHGSMHHLYKYKPNHHNYRPNPLYESRQHLLLPPSNSTGKIVSLSPEMKGKLVHIRRNKEVAHKLPVDDPFFRNLDWAKFHNPEGLPLVNPSVNQKSCGSCWAFAAVGSLETSVARNSKNETAKASLPLLSVQELLNCFSPEHCEIGGNPLSAFDYIYRFGLSSAVKTPYTGTPGQCSTHHTAKKPLAKVTAWGMVAPNHDAHVQLALRYLGPVAAAMNGAHPAFVNYRSGIFAPLDCSPTPNHAVLLTGYGETMNGTKYWIARNSWGREWGEDGYVRILRQKYGMGVCGILHSPSIALGGYRPSDEAAQQQHEKLSLAMVLFLVLCTILLLMIPLSHVCRSPWNERRELRRKRQQRLLKDERRRIAARPTSYGSTTIT